MPRKGLKKRDDSDDEEAGAVPGDQPAGDASVEGAVKVKKGRGRLKKGSDSEEEDDAPKEDWKARKAKQEQERAQAQQVLKVPCRSHSTWDDCTAPQ